MALGACGPADAPPQVAEVATGTTQQELEDEYKTWGRGYNKLTDSAAGTCVIPGTPVPASNWSGQVSYYALELVESAEKLQQKLDVSAAADVKIGLGQSVDISARFARDVNMSSTSVYVVATVIVQNAPQSIPDARLTQEAYDLLATNPAQFREMCGDGFLAGMKLGAEYRSVLQINTRSQEEKNQITANLGVKLPTVDGQASFEHMLNTELSQRQVYTWAYQRGGNGSQDLPVCLDAACVIAQAQNIPSIATTAPVPFSHSFLPYTTLPRPPSSVIDVGHQEWVQSELRRERLQTEAVRSQYQLAQAAPADYEALDPTVVQNTINALSARIDTVWQASRQCYFNYNNCVIPALSALPAPPRWVVPAAPSMLAASVSGAAVVLSWKDNSSNESGFAVFRKQTSASGWTQLATTGANAVNYTDATAPSGVSHDYYVRAVTPGSASIGSNVVTIIAPHVANRSFTFGQVIKYSGTSTNSSWQGAFVPVSNSGTSFYLASEASLNAHFDFWFTYPTNYTYMYLDLRYVLDGIEVARVRLPKYATVFDANLGRVAPGWHTLSVEARTVLSSGPPGDSELVGYSSRNLYWASVGGHSGTSNLTVGVTGL